MSKQINDIGDALAVFAAKYGPVVIQPATVLKINNDDTIQVQLSNGFIIEDVRLKSVIKDGNKVILSPKESSIVQIARIDTNDDYVVISVEEVTKVLYQIDHTTFDVDRNGYLLKCENETLRKLLDDLLDAIMNMRFTTQSGPTVNLVNLMTFQQIKNRVKNLLKDA
jgi:hypothetical protein